MRSCSETSGGASRRSYERAIRWRTTLPTGRDEPAVLIRLPTGCAPAIARAVAEGVSLVLDDRVYAVGP
eukprot:8851032-Lingulodinium_polyedra.AAC.1